MCVNINVQFIFICYSGSGLLSGVPTYDTSLTTGFVFTLTKHGTSIRAIILKAI